MTKDSKTELLEVGSRLKALRKNLNLPQKELAQRLDLSGSYLSEVEAGKTKPGFDLIKNLAEHFGVNLEYLVHGQGEMFVKKREPVSLGRKGIGESITSVDELLWYMENSPLFMHTMIAYATKFLYDNETIVKKDIELFQAGQAKAAVGEENR